jgi:hypothetical protein
MAAPSSEVLASLPCGAAYEQFITERQYLKNLSVASIYWQRSSPKAALEHLPSDVVGLNSSALKEDGHSSWADGSQPDGDQRNFEQR